MSSLVLSPSTRLLGIYLFMRFESSPGLPGDKFAVFSCVNIEESIESVCSQVELLRMGVSL